MKTIKITITGRVTGVGFRFSALNEARGHPGLRGWVRNRDSRAVEAMVQGENQAVDAMAEWFRRGPIGARVESCHIEEVPDSGQLEPFHVA